MSVDMADAGYWDSGEQCEVGTELMSLRVQVRKLTKEAERLKGLRNLCGFVEDGSNESVTICQDDATRDWTIRVGGPGSRKWWYGHSFENVIDAAMQEDKP